MKIDFITRLVGVKTNQIAGVGAPVKVTIKGFNGPTLLHLVAWEAYESMPDMLTIFDKWNAVMAAADLSFRQVETQLYHSF